MLFKRLYRVAIDILDVLGRLEILWKLLTLTTAGQLVLALISGVGIFAFTLVRSDPLISAVLFALSGFALVAVIARLHSG